MKWRLAFVAWVLGSLLWLQSGVAQFNGCPAGFCSPSRVGGGPTYTGLGDIVSPLVFGSCARAVTAAYAAAHSSGCTIQRASDSATCTTVFATNGFIDLAVQTPCAGATVTAFLTSTTAIVTKLFDQIGTLTGGWVPGASVAFTLSAVNSLPCMTFANSAGLASTTSWATAGASAAPYSASTVSKRTGNVTNFQQALGDSGSSGFIGFNSAANSTAIFDGGNIITNSTNSTDNAFHAIQGLFAGTSSEIVTDGAASTTGAGASSITWTGVPNVGGGFDLTGLVCEVAFMNGNQSASFSAINTNQHSSTSGYNF